MKKRKARVFGAACALRACFHVVPYPLLGANIVEARAVCGELIFRLTRLHRSSSGDSACEVLVLWVLPSQHTGHPISTALFGLQHQSSTTYRSCGCLALCPALTRKATLRQCDPDSCMFPGFMEYDCRQVGAGFGGLGLADYKSRDCAERRNLRD